MISSVLASEWVKIRSVRSTWYILGMVVAAVVLAGLLTWRGMQVWESLAPDQRLRAGVLRMEHLVLPVMQLCVAVLGALTITAEYTTGVIRTSLVSVPSRLTLLAGKAGVIAVIALVIGITIPAATHLLSEAIVADRLDSLDPAAKMTRDVRVLVGTGLSTMVIGVVALGIGAALRSTAGALIVVIALLFALPMLASYLPEPWDVRVASVALSNLPLQLTRPADVAGTLSLQGVFVVMLTYVSMAWGAAAVVFVRADA